MTTRATASGAFDRLSLVIDLNADLFAFHPIYALIPGAFERPILRVFSHELLHFWQTLSSGFLMNVALQEWDHVQAIDSGSGESRDLSRNTLIRGFSDVEPDAGFSAWHLHEALCRYWDIHILGPQNVLRDNPPLARANAELDELLAIPPPTSAEAALSPPEWMLEGLDPDVAERARNYRPTGYRADLFDGVMQVEDSYAEPYRLMLERFGSKTSVILFPLIGYFALQTRKPVAFFSKMIERLSSEFTLSANPEISIHKLWREVFDRVRHECYQSSSRLTGSYITPGFPVILTGFRKHPAYTHFASWLGLTQNWWNPRTDFYFALPGDPESRNWLVSWVLPPVVQFRDGIWTPISSLYKLFLAGRSIGEKWPNNCAGDSPAKAVQDPEKLVKGVLDLHIRVQAIREQDLVRRLSQPRAASQVGEA
jgi:hypothetical protein